MANIIPNSFRGALFEANHNFKASVETLLKFHYIQLIHIRHRQLCI